ncbi:hypothetical protein [Tabrizicola soli]|uniref:DUF4129 domain-containing protein n=1 Tax=Tabrizicola soli TaxID=2185115 RepID=A0ABV7E013_9RHOB|nr:hypothetical protein [Tabrizicola soli]
MLEDILWNTAIVATAYAVIRFCDHVVKPWYEGRKPGAGSLDTAQTIAMQLLTLRKAYDQVMASPSLNADERARARRAYLEKVRRMADRLANP